VPAGWCGCSRSDCKFIPPRVADGSAKLLHRGNSSCQFIIWGTLAKRHTSPASLEADHVASEVEACSSHHSNGVCGGASCDRAHHCDENPAFSRPKGWHRQWRCAQPSHAGRHPLQWWLSSAVACAIAAAQRQSNPASRRWRAKPQHAPSRSLKMKPLNFIFCLLAAMVLSATFAFAAQPAGQLRLVHPAYPQPRNFGGTPANYCTSCSPPHGYTLMAAYPGEQCIRKKITCVCNGVKSTQGVCVYPIGPMPSANPRPPIRN
jgi:hypothetical protein